MWWILQSSVYKSPRRFIKGVWSFCGALSPILCSREVVDEQVPCIRMPLVPLQLSENESVAGESPVAHVNTVLSVEEHSPLSERFARRAQLHDVVRVHYKVVVSDEHQVSARNRTCWGWGRFRSSRYARGAVWVTRAIAETLIYSVSMRRACRLCGECTRAGWSQSAETHCLRRAECILHSR